MVNILTSHQLISNGFLLFVGFYGCMLSSKNPQEKQVKYVDLIVAGIYNLYDESAP